MITTIQLNNSVKNTLNNFKETGRQTYEDVIINLISIAEQQKILNQELLIEGYKEMAEDSLRICKEWEAVDSELDWEWDECGN